MDLAQLPSSPVVAAGEKIIACDLDRIGRLACIARQADGSTVVEIDAVTCPTPGTVTPGIRHIAWLSDEEALVWPVISLDGERDAAHSYGVVSQAAFRLLPLGSSDRAFVSGAFVFGAYGEHRVLGEAIGPYDDDVVSVFDRATGERLFGAQELLPDQAAPFFTELESGCAVGGQLTFVADGTPILWILDADRRTLSHIVPAVSLGALPDGLAVHEDEVRLLWLDADGVRVRRIDRRTGEELEAATLAFETSGTMSGSRAQARGLADGRFVLWSDTDVACLSP